MSVQGTSLEAWDSVQGEPVRSVRERVWRLLQVAADYGRTDDEMERATGLRHQTLSAARRGLSKDGLIVDSGRRRKTRSGRNAIVWVIPEDDGREQEWQQEAQPAPDPYPWPF